MLEKRGDIIPEDELKGKTIGKDISEDELKANFPGSRVVILGPYSGLVAQAQYDSGRCKIYTDENKTITSIIFG